ncbi:MAG: MaoC family dehydratase N-terminal domain-containing protein [Emcibacter sp.]|nr:MaoC family dehydratase N-terminal domain-containing protein [Emcibacter sp.]
MTRIDIKDIQQYIGSNIGTSKWVEITQSRVNRFAEATGNFQWIHVDEERARTEMPAGLTIIHNYLLLSLIPQLFDQLVTITGLEYGKNQGAENVQFLRSLNTGSKIRIQLKLSKVEYRDSKGPTANFYITMEEQGSDKAVLTMDLQVLFVAVQKRNMEKNEKAGLKSVSSNQHQPVALGL